MNAVVLLAAGSSRRFGADKLTWSIAGLPLVEHTARRISASGRVDLCLAVVPAGSLGLHTLLRSLGIELVVCADSRRGLSASIKAGVGALAAQVERAAFALADQPVPTGVLDTMFAAEGTDGADAVVPLYHGVRGNPVLFAASFFPALAGLQGDAGARSLLREEGLRVMEIEMGIDMPPDMDLPEDVPVLENYLGR